MKKTLSILLTAIFALSNTQAVLADDNIQNALLSVKEKVQIPEALSEFETYTESDSEGNVRYGFSWSDEEGDKSINISADQYGNITEYYEFDSEWYNKYDDTNRKIDANFDIQTLEKQAKNELSKLVPDLFDNDITELVPVPYTYALNTNPNNNFTFEFKREYEGIEVKDNEAYVIMTNTDNGYVMSRAMINWDYTSEFVLVDDTVGFEKAEVLLAEANPLELAYRKTYDDKYFLEYTLDDVSYISAENGAEIEEDPSAQLYKFANESTALTSVNDSAAGQISLTPAEIAELEKINELKSTNELLEILYSMPELKVEKVLYPNAVQTYTGKYDNTDTYITTLYIDTRAYFKDDEEITKDLYYSATLNAKTGEIISFSRNNWSSSKENSISEEDGNKKADEFLKKYCSEKISKCKKSSDQASYTRLVNDIPYLNNSIYANWNLKDDCIANFYTVWDDDVSKIPAPEGIISNDEALEIMYNKYPIKKLYVMSDGMYRQVYTNSEYSIQIDAFSKKFTDYDGKEITDAPTGIYSDTEGHWVENIAKTLAKYGIALEGELLLPDSEITQADFLKLVYNGVLGSSPLDTDYLYRRVINLNILSEEEMNSTATLTKENAIRYLLRAMEIKEVAEIPGIFICDFKDSEDISPDKIGYCTIAKGLGIISGCDGYLYPKKNITRAEALSMIYSYLTR